MKVVVSGASGLIGSALVPALRAEGHEVIRLVRREAVASDEVRWDPAAGELDAGALRGTDAIVNLSGENVGKRWTEARKRVIRDSHVNSMHLLATTAAALEPKPSAFVCAGGIDVYGDRGDEILTEESGLGEGFLAEVGRAKEAAADPARSAGVRVVNFRQGIVLAAHGGALERMLPFFKLGIGGPVAGGRQCVPWVHLDDVVGAMVHCLDTEAARGPVNVVAPEPATNAELSKTLGRVLTRPAFAPVPGFAVKTLYGEMAMIVTTGQCAVPARLEEQGYRFRRPELEAALRDATGR